MSNILVVDEDLRLRFRRESTHIDYQGQLTNNRPLGLMMMVELRF